MDLPDHQRVINADLFSEIVAATILDLDTCRKCVNSII
jgi:hypothetical protein